MRRRDPEGDSGVVQDAGRGLLAPRGHGVQVPKVVGLADVAWIRIARNEAMVSGQSRLAHEQGERCSALDILFAG